MNLLNLFKNRARESSSYAGVAALLVLFGLPAEVGPLVHTVIEGVTALAALAAIIIPERGKDAAPK